MSDEGEPKPGSGKLLLYSLILAMLLLWAGNFIIGKVALREFPPLLAGGLRTALAGLLMVPVFLWQRARTPRETWTRRDWRVLLLLGVFGVSLNQVFFLIGLKRTTVAHSAFVVGLMPILVLLIAVLAGQERLAGRRLAGMIIAFGGVVWLNAFPAGTPAQVAGPSLLGDLFIFLSILSFAAFTVFGKEVSRRHSGITVSTIGYAAGAVALAPLTLWYARDFPFASISTAAWMSLLYMALFPSVICYLIYYFALTKISASRLAAFGYVQPVLAVALGTAILREPLTPALAAGGAIILCGVYFAERG
ncbi:MAG: DMT family transporter [Bryobacterales bacterium]|nr:DMT family transporter [Bryobacterales bacterium]